MDARREAKRISGIFARLATTQTRFLAATRRDGASWAHFCVARPRHTPGMPSGSRLELRPTRLRRMRDSKPDRLQMIRRCQTSPPDRPFTAALPSAFDPYRARRPCAASPVAAKRARCSRARARRARRRARDRRSVWSCASVRLPSSSILVAAMRGVPKLNFGARIASRTAWMSREAIFDLAVGARLVDEQVELLGQRRDRGDCARSRNRRPRCRSGAPPRYPAVRRSVPTSRSRDDRD